MPGVGRTCVHEQVKEKFSRSPVCVQGGNSPKVMNKIISLGFWQILLCLYTVCGLMGCSIDAEGRRVIGGPGFGKANLYGHPTLKEYDQVTKTVGINNRSDAINRYLSNKELAAIEGLWV